MEMGTNLRIAYAAAWCEPVFLIGYIIAFSVLGWNHPPPSPRFDARPLVEHYFVPHDQQIMLGRIIRM
ncbi:hypothetical protein MRAB57_2636 [Mycobacterium rhizamassiliense]|uniref:Uncharacterized protein n=2 Tax=Mycobacterium TaxID=1763 RepID=A0A2U3PA81_9MYCO|nr:hypothetical protein MRAB57_2636 [Mycobacterium rhizamassiliense]SPM40642.1 hypothetical protein MNAB215_2843 [Mycobacterium numidiamassiliense]